MGERSGVDQRLGGYLKDRRSKLDAAAFGFPAGRRRTPGLRREEVAQRANISPTWYTWLEQGRGGAPSAEVLDRLARALMLTELEREHLFLLGLRRLPEPRYRKDEGVTPRLRRVLAALEPCPAVIRTATWDVIAWNRAATVLLGDYSAMPPSQRNLLRRIFLDPAARQAHAHWESVARFVVSAFRVDAARAGAGSDVEPLVDELSRLSPEFRAMWAENEILPHGEGVKQIGSATLGRIRVEYSTFAVDGRSDLSLLVYNPLNPADADRIAELAKAVPTAD
ncbi:MAG: helix-turn-helix domain-containing protein [Caulobacterales bacterium]|nr:helix-turn-helix domain-containing protein [Caulobacterales bacterium]